MGEHTNLFVLVAAFLCKDIFLSFKNTGKEHTKAIQENTLAITKLEVQLEHTNQKLGEIPTMKKDIDSAHESIRALRDRFSGPR